MSIRERAGLAPVARMLAALAWLTLISLGMLRARAHAQPGIPKRTGPHGAASSGEQLEQLAQLLPARGPGPGPGHVDRALWRRAVAEPTPARAAQAALGRQLYFETALSRDDTVSCATCHDVSRSFADRRPISEGVGDRLGRRNSPTTMNVALLRRQFWDGRAASLQAQALQPILNPVEMGMPDPASAVQALKDRGYAPQFRQVFGRAISFADIGQAIAAFERTLIFVDAPFDRYQAGDTRAISDDAKAGWTLFTGKAGCIGCHPLDRAHPLGTDQRFYNLGVSARRPEHLDRLAAQAPTVPRQAHARGSSGGGAAGSIDQLALASSLSDLGRFLVTRKRADIGAFRTPQLRNVGITAPYMHDGSLQTLWDALDHLNRGGAPNPYLHRAIRPLGLRESELGQLVAFLFSLTDDRFARLNHSEFQRQRARSVQHRPLRDQRLQEVHP